MLSPITIKTRVKVDMQQSQRWTDSTIAKFSIVDSNIEVGDTALSAR